MAQNRATGSDWIYRKRKPFNDIYTATWAAVRTRKFVQTYAWTDVAVRFVCKAVATMIASPTPERHTTHKSVHAASTY